MSAHYKFFLLVMFSACITGYFLVVEESDVDLPPIKPEAALFNHVELPDFSVHSVVKKKKQAFFGFLLPLVEAENKRLMVLREKILELRDLPEITVAQRKWLQKLAIYYRLPEDIPFGEELFNRLLRRVDTIPPSLALAQSANESSWGTSRFAVEGNNLYGQWCFKEGCGLVPELRDEDAKYEVAAFKNPSHSVQRYIYNLNTFSAYQDFRIARAQLREQGKPLLGKKLADGLLSYSTRGEEYIAELRAMIRVNRLSQYDHQEIASAESTL